MREAVGDELPAGGGVGDEGVGREAGQVRDRGPVNGAGGAGAEDVGYAGSTAGRHGGVRVGTHVKGGGDAVLAHGGEVGAGLDVAVGVDEAGDEIAAFGVDGCCAGGGAVGDDSADQDDGFV